jgi:hypothetical protein
MGILERLGLRNPTKMLFNAAATSDVALAMTALRNGQTRRRESQQKATRPLRRSVSLKTRCACLRFSDRNHGLLRDDPVLDSVSIQPLYDNTEETRWK